MTPAEEEALLVGYRGRGRGQSFDVAMIDRLVALAQSVGPKSWRSRYFGHESVRVFIVGDRLRALIPWRPTVHV